MTSKWLSIKMWFIFTSMHLDLFTFIWWQMRKRADKISWDFFFVSSCHHHHPYGTSHLHLHTSSFSSSSSSFPSFWCNQLSSVQSVLCTHNKTSSWRTLLSSFSFLCLLSRTHSSLLSKGIWWWRPGWHKICWTWQIKLLMSGEAWTTDGNLCLSYIKTSF